MFEDEREKFAFLSPKLSRLRVCTRLICFTHTKNKLDLNFSRRTKIHTDTFSAAVNVMALMIRLPQKTLFSLLSSFAVRIIAIAAIIISLAMNHLTMVHIYFYGCPILSVSNA